MTGEWKVMKQVETVGNQKEKKRKNEEKQTEISYWFAAAEYYGNEMDASHSCSISTLCSVQWRMLNIAENGTLSTLLEGF